MFLPLLCKCYRFTHQMKSIYIRSVSGGIVLPIALAVLLGLQVEKAIFGNFFLLVPKISDASASVMLFVSLALLIYRKEAENLWLGRAGLLLPFLAMSISLWIVLQTIFAPENDTTGSNANSLLPLLSWFVLGLSIFLVSLRRGILLGFSLVLSFAALIIPWIILFSYASLAFLEFTQQGAPIFVISPIEALCILLASLGAISLTPERTVIAAMSISSRGSVKRFLIPLLIFIPLIFSWAFIYIQEYDIVSPSEIFAISWGVVSLFMVFMIVLPGLIFFARDHERDQLVDNLSKAERKFRGLLESAPDAMVIVNKLGEIVFVNTQTERLFGYEKDELIGAKVESLMPDKYSTNHESHRTNYFQSPKVRMMGEGLELSGRRKDGQEFPVEISLSPIETEEGLLVSAAIRDITEAKKARDEIQDLNRTLEQKVMVRTQELEQARDTLEDEVKKRTQELQLTIQELESFSYSVSHDLRAPLRAVAGYSGILKEDYYDKLDDEGKRTLKIIIKNTNRMGQLIDDILAFARYHRTEIKQFRLDISAMFSEALHHLIQLENNSRKLEFQVNKMPDVYGDREMINQMIINLVSNALKYSRPKELTEIQVGCTKNKDEVVYFIKDNGVGFDERYKNKLFGVFQRLHKDTEFEGTGVGLAIVQRIIHRHGGKIWAESKLNEGATFYFTLPNKKENVNR